MIKPGGYTDIKNELHIVYTSARGKRWTNVLAGDYAQDFFIDKEGSSFYLWTL